MGGQQDDTALLRFDTMKRKDVIHNRVELCEFLKTPHDASDNSLSEKLDLPCGGHLKTRSFGVFIEAAGIPYDVILFPFSIQKWRKTMARIALDIDLEQFEYGF